MINEFQINELLNSYRSSKSIEWDNSIISTIDIEKYKKWCSLGVYYADPNSEKRENPISMSISCSIFVDPVPQTLTNSKPEVGILLGWSDEIGNFNKKNREARKLNDYIIEQKIDNEEDLLTIVGVGHITGKPEAIKDWIEIKNVTNVEDDKIKKHLEHSTNFIKVT